MPRRRAVVIGKGGPRRARRLGDENRPAAPPPPARPHQRAAVPRGHRPRAGTPTRARRPRPRCNTGRARLSYRRDEELFSASSGGWTLHELRHSRLTHLAEHGILTRVLPAQAHVYAPRPTRGAAQLMQDRGWFLLRYYPDSTLFASHPAISHIRRSPAMLNRSDRRKVPISGVDGGSLRAILFAHRS